MCFALHGIAFAIRGDRCGGASFTLVCFALVMTDLRCVVWGLVLWLDLGIFSSTRCDEVIVGGCEKELMSEVGCLCFCEIGTSGRRIVMMTTLLYSSGRGSETLLSCRNIYNLG